MKPTLSEYIVHGSKKLSSFSFSHYFYLFQYTQAGCPIGLPTFAHQSTPKSGFKRGSRHWVEVTGKGRGNVLLYPQIFEYY